MSCQFRPLTSEKRLTPDRRGHRDERRAQLRCTTPKGRNITSRRSGFQSIQCNHFRHNLSKAATSASALIHQLPDRDWNLHRFQGVAGTTVWGKIRSCRLRERVSLFYPTFRTSSATLGVLSVQSRHMENVEANKALKISCTQK